MDRPSAALQSPGIQAKYSILGEWRCALLCSQVHMKCTQKSKTIQAAAAAAAEREKKKEHTQKSNKTQPTMERMQWAARVR